MNFINVCLCTLLANFEWWRRRQGGIWYKVRRHHIDDPVVWGPIEGTVWTQTPEDDDDAVVIHIPKRHSFPYSVLIALWYDGFGVC